MWKLLCTIIVPFLCSCGTLSMMDQINLELRNFGRQYANLLKTWPIIINSITSCIIGSFASLTAQLIRNAKMKTSGINVKKIRARGIFGLLVPGPLLNFFFKWLHTKGPSNPILKLIIHQFGFGPIFHLIVLYLVPRFEGISHTETEALIKRIYVRSFLAKLKLWIPAMYLNINYVPFEFQVLVGNLVAFIWTTYISYIQSNYRKENQICSIGEKCTLAMFSCPTKKSKRN